MYLEEEDNHGFIISEIDSFDKYSDNYVNCTCLIAIWKSLKNWKNISFMTHQDPSYFLSTEKSKKNPWYKKSTLFKVKLNSALQGLNELCEKWTIDVVLLWGILNKWDEEYDKSIKVLSEITFDIIWFYPEIQGLLTISIFKVYFYWKINFSKYWKKRGFV